MLKNYMEDVVSFYLPLVLKDFNGDVCTCAKCLEDIKAIALNNLKPHYTSTKNERVYAKLYELNMQFQADVIQQLTRAVDKVSKNPRHFL